MDLDGPSPEMNETINPAATPAAGTGFKPLLLIGGVLVAVICAPGLLAKNGVDLFDATPPRVCDAGLEPYLRQQVKRTPAGKNMDLRIIAFKGHRTVEDRADDLRCESTVMLSTGLTTTATYRLYVDRDMSPPQQFVAFEVDVFGLK